MKTIRTVSACLAAGLLLAGCDIPTDAPIIDQQWVIPVEETSVGVDELLPAGVSVSAGNFSVAVDPLATNEDLGTLCAACGALNLTSAPKPAFTHNFTVSQTLPADVQSATIASGSVDITLSHTLGFDPIRPPGGTTGTVTITARDGAGGPAIGQVVIDGATDTFTSGVPLSRTMTLTPTTVGSTVELEVAVVSPAGGTTPADFVPINTSTSVSASATVTSLLVSSASVNVESTSVSLEPQSLDVDDIDSSLTERIIEGGIVLDVVNPFGVSISGTIVIGPTTKSFAISAGATSQVSLVYSGEELRSFLGQPGITFSGSGTASGGLVTVTPDQELLIEATLDFTIRIGG